MRQARRAPDTRSVRDPYMRATEVAKRLKLHRATIYVMIERGDLKAVRFGNAVRILTSSVDEYEAAALVAAGVAS